MSLGTLFANLRSAPLSYLDAAGPASRPVLALDWGLIAISCVVTVIVAALLIVGVFRHRKQPADPQGIATEAPATGWITIGVSISVVVLFASTVWMLLVLHAVRPPEGDGALQVDVTAQQFWWSFHYAADGGTSQDGFTTANELHIPVGRPVRLRVTSTDVIHSFWVPKLAGKTDMIPGQINDAWLQADQPGIYRGQCGEFCGLEHGEMAFNVVAQSPDDFAAWRKHQLEQPATDPALTQAADLFDARCGSCHAVRGTPAQANIAPDLSHIASRQRIASGVLPNDDASMRAWLRDPAAVKPGTPMPKIGLSDKDLDSIAAYIASLK